MIGILKALGSQNSSIRKVFLYNAFYLILKGLFWGNIIGLTIIGIQHFFKIITHTSSIYLYFDIFINHIPKILK